MWPAVPLKGACPGPGASFVDSKLTLKSFRTAYHEFAEARGRTVRRSSAWRWSLSSFWCLPCRSRPGWRGTTASALFVMGALARAATGARDLIVLEFLEASDELFPGLDRRDKASLAAYHFLRGKNFDIAYFPLEGGLGHFPVSAKQTAVSGREAAIEAFGQFLKQHNVMFKVLALSGAFHTPLFASAAARM